MKSNKKINAFTLSEMLVVLVISSIVISLAFVLLSMVQKQIKSIQHNFNTKQQVYLVERLLWKDFNQHTVSYQKNTDALLLTSSIDSVTYLFYDNYLIRKNDTLPIEIKNKQLFLDGKEVDLGFIDAIKIETTPVFGNTKLFICKTKDAAFYINN